MKQYHGINLTALKPTSVFIPLTHIHIPAHLLLPSVLLPTTQRADPLGPTLEMVLANPIILSPSPYLQAPASRRLRITALQQHKAKAAPLNARRQSGH